MRTRNVKELRNRNSLAYRRYDQNLLLPPSLKNAAAMRESGCGNARVTPLTTCPTSNLALTQSAHRLTRSGLHWASQWRRSTTSVIAWAERETFGNGFTWPHTPSEPVPGSALGMGSELGSGRQNVGGVTMSLTKIGLHTSARQMRRNRAGNSWCR